jgi:uncharacterized membrane protein
LTGVLRPVLSSGKPVVILAETYTGAGELMMEAKRIIEKRLKAVYRSTRNVTNLGLIMRYVRLLKALQDVRAQGS